MPRLLVPAVLPAATEHGKRAVVVRQELGISCRFLSEITAGVPDDQLPASAAHASAGSDEKRRRSGESAEGRGVRERRAGGETRH
jgi:hypothetical protein